MLLSAPPAIVPVLVVIFFAAGTAFGFVLVRRAILARATPDAGTSAPDVANARIAIESFDPAGTPERAYTQLSKILERYLDARFHLATAGMAGADIERAVVRGGATQPVARALAQIIERGRAAASGGANVTPERVRGDVRAAREIVRTLDAADR